MIYRSLRGGSFDSAASDLRAAIRLWFQPDGPDRYVGFRLVIRREP